MRFTWNTELAMNCKWQFIIPSELYQTNNMHDKEDYLHNINKPSKELKQWLDNNNVDYMTASGTHNTLLLYLPYASDSEVITFKLTFDNVTQV